jgi:phage antirepressor YoqD-like protein
MKNIKQAFSNNREFLNLLKEERDKRKDLEAVIEKIAPKAEYYDLILQCTNAIPASVIAKDYGMSASAFNRLLYYARIQYKVGGSWVLYRKHDKKGYTVSRTHQINDSKAVVYTCWTQAGRKMIYDALKEFRILPEVEYMQGCTDL